MMDMDTVIMDHIRKNGLAAEEVQQFILKARNIWIDQSDICYLLYEMGIYPNAAKQKTNPNRISWSQKGTINKETKYVSLFNGTSKNNKSKKFPKINELGAEEILSRINSDEDWVIESMKFGNEILSEKKDPVLNIMPESETEEETKLKRLENYDFVTGLIKDLKQANQQIENQKISINLLEKEKAELKAKNEEAMELVKVSDERENEYKQKIEDLEFKNEELKDEILQLKQTNAELMAEKKESALEKAIKRIVFDAMKEKEQ